VIVVGVRVAVTVVGRRDNLSGALRSAGRSGVGYHVVRNGRTRSISAEVVAVCGSCVLLVPAKFGVCRAAFFATNQYNSSCTIAASSIRAQVAAGCGGSGSACAGAWGKVISMGA